MNIDKQGWRNIGVNIVCELGCVAFLSLGCFFWSIAFTGFVCFLVSLAALGQVLRSFSVNPLPESMDFNSHFLSSWTLSVPGSFTETGREGLNPGFPRQVPGFSVQRGGSRDEDRQHGEGRGHELGNLPRVVPPRPAPGSRASRGPRAEFFRPPVVPF